ncbi:hypothetical protein STAQ_24740 [Allostella sp. ATCC 35155]|nr:hypothetical protein STAQ_24740 [Stella sp. ATCC 35155]
MEKRKFGRTGLELAVLGFGCGAVGGLMVRGEPAAQERTVAEAIEAGINYFDTAVQYGDGQSERNLGRILRSLRPQDAVVGTKVRLTAADRSDIAGAIARSLEGSLGRLGMERVDILYLHNPITGEGDGATLPVRTVRDEVLPAIGRLRDAGKLRFVGITAIGETPALKSVMASGAVDAAQVVFNLLNPSAASPPPLPADPGDQDYGGLLGDAAATGVGTVGIRVLAGGALSGEATRHPIASPAPAPIGSSADYETDLARARRLAPILADGHAASLSEAATRFAAWHSGLGTILVGMASREQFHSALAAVRRGALPAEALARLGQIASGQ